MSQIQGKCHCGHNEFSVQGAPEFQFVCYCKGCQVLNGGGHLCGVMFDETNLTPSENTRTYSYDGGSGRSIIIHFCPTCSTQLYAYPTEYKGKVVVRANVMNESYEFNPQQNLFTESAFSWDQPKDK
ncbi:GFA family protein [Piscirickettsia litoralis]|uniref:CENP-V/GFA domain-containing protein n=1 Tax=Piscirickettsia litoralis TaxID=1891921 RepID=A0ABX3A4C7_9GAMM|nr:GFA family protein [Piscirickettsia litoralis]ODN43722.1 hypothetical protein BGC07_13480 [Piscirickettsia litoralis]